MWGCGLLKVAHLDFTMITSWNGQVAGLSWNMESSIGTGQLIETLFIATPQSPLMDRSLRDSAGSDTGSVSSCSLNQREAPAIEDSSHADFICNNHCQKRKSNLPVLFFGTIFKRTTTPKAKTRPIKPKWTKLVQPNQLNPIKSNQSQPHQSKEIRSNQTKSDVWAQDKHKVWF